MNSTDNKILYGLIGYPLTHSFSRDFFNCKFAAEGINAEYINFEIDDIGHLMELVAEFPELRGLNVTAPYKEQVISFLTGLSPQAQAIGAVNVIKIIHDPNDGQVVGLEGHNTDMPAFANTLKPLVTPSLTHALVLGTGGAAKAVSHALRDMGIEVQLVSRRKSSTTMTYEEITRATVASHQLIVNATPLGKWPDVESCPDFPYRFITSNHLCYDLIYNPDETEFMRRSAQAGARVKNGLEMLLLQAFHSYQIWTAS